MRLIRPSATTRLIAVSSSPASSIRPAGAPFSDTLPTTASGANVLKRERRLATRSRPTTGRRKAATSPPPSATSTTSGASTSNSTSRWSTGPKRRQEPVDHLLVLGTIDPYPWPPRGHVLPGPVSDLPDRGRRLVDRCRDVGVGQVEDLAQDEDRPFGGREGLQHG